MAGNGLFAGPVEIEECNRGSPCGCPCFKYKFELNLLLFFIFRVIFFNGNDSEYVIGSAIVGYRQGKCESFDVWVNVLNCKIKSCGEVANVVLPDTKIRERDSGTVLS